MDADVLIIGAGAAGAAVSWRLASLGHSVLCVEQGDFQVPTEYPSTRASWEIEKISTHSPFPNVRKGAADYPINDDDSPISIANFNAVGGSTILYSGHFPRMHPSDFKTRTLDGVADDWPITYSNLEPYFALNEKMMGVSGLEGDPAYPPITGLLPPVPMGVVGETLAKGYNRMGWHWWPSYAAIATRPHGNRAPCVNLGPCNTGCAQSAKGSVDVTYWPEALAMGVNLLTNTRVLRIVVDKDGVAVGIEARLASGARTTLKAKRVVVACNGVGTPRLLLQSRTEHHPEGLANSSDQVGRNLMLHPLGYVEGLFEEDLQSHLGPQGCCIASHEFYETRPENDFVRGYSMQVLRGPAPLETAMSGVLRREIGWGESHHEGFARRFGHIASLATIIEDLPEEHNRVTLDETLVDSDGIPAPRIKYRLADNSKRMLTQAIQNGRTLMKEAGAVRTYGFGPVRETGWHLMGTTRMGEDPKRSVVDRNGQSHDVPHLYVADSSVFVTSGGVNPTATLQAIALMIADAVSKSLGLHT
jgi:choline dehydrogenase-like flavoprotein